MFLESYILSYFAIFFMGIVISYLIFNSQKSNIYRLLREYVEECNQLKDVAEKRGEYLIKENTENLKLQQKVDKQRHVIDKIAKESSYYFPEIMPSSLNPIYEILSEYYDDEC